MLRMLYTSSILSEIVVWGFSHCFMNIQYPDSEDDYKFPFIWCMFVRASLYMCREETQLDATEWFICSTCFGHLYAHHQGLEAILVLLPHMVCNAGGRRSGARQQAMRPGWGKLLEQLPCAHHQELEAIFVLLPHMVSNALVAGGRRSGAGQQDMRPGRGKLLEQHYTPYAIKTQV